MSAPGRRAAALRAVLLATLAAACGSVAPGAASAEGEPAAVAGGAPAARPAATGGEVLYLRYCASCHGTSGRGDGPVAADLRERPTDLTRIAQRNGGRFDERALIAVIDGRRAVAAHGSRTMPVWGDVFDAELEGAPHAGRQNLLRSSALVDWLRSIQVR